MGGGTAREGGRRPNEYPRFTTEIDGQRIHFVGHDHYGAHGNDAGSIISPILGQLDRHHVTGVHVTQIFSFPRAGSRYRPRPSRRNRPLGDRVGTGVKRFLVVVAVLAVSACSAERSGGEQSTGAAPLRGFGIEVDRAVSARVQEVHLKVCGTWGCAEQDVPLNISGPTSAAPCPGPTSGPDGVACGPVHLPGPGTGYGYAPVPQLTADPVTVTVTTPAGADLPIRAEVRVQPHLVCPDAGADPATCAGSAPQATIRIAADGTASQSR